MLAKIRSKYKKVYQSDEVAILDNALELADEKHKGQKRKSGKPYIAHPVAVADILIDLGVDYTAVAAAFLHDVVEDTDVTAQELKEKFGDTIAELVTGVTKLKDFKFKSKRQEQAENFRRMYIMMSKNHLVLVIKLADRLHNMRTVEFLAPDRQVEFATETQEIYAPLASRLGLSYIKCELEDLCLKALKPNEFNELNVAVSEKRKKFGAVLSQIQKKLKEILDKFNIEGSVSGRPKHLYSIYKKMNRKDNPRTLEQIFDLTAVRVLVENIPDCYTVLGAVHDAWRPIKDRFKDYISVPKINNYRSLHTTVMTEFKIPCEIQIRTIEMHRVAEYGIAAHWIYKEKANESDKLAKNKKKRQDKRQAKGANEIDNLSWLPGMGDVESDATTSEEFYDAVKFDFNHKEIFVFTPRGDIIMLPEGATSVDFAYRVHSEVGNRCSGSKINGRIVPLETELKSGDYVEILSSGKIKGPSRDWLRFAKTTQAITKIKAFFKKLAKSDNIEKGKELLELDAKRRGYVLSHLLSPKWLDPIMHRYAIANLDDLYAAIGYGGYTVGQIIPKLVDFYKKSEAKKKEIKNFTGKTLQVRQSIIVDGHDDLLIRLAQCCTPAPGDDILGFISRGRGISVHRTSCHNLKGIEIERLIKTNWATSATKEPFVVQLQVEAQNSEGLLLKLTTLISGQKLFIHSLNARADKQNTGIITIGVQVSHLSQIEQLISKINTMGQVEKVYRL